jgi:hypothetical protein
MYSLIYFSKGAQQLPKTPAVQNISEEFALMLVGVTTTLLPLPFK